MFFKTQRTCLFAILIIILLIIFDVTKTWGRSLNEILSTGNFKVAVLDPQKDEFDMKESIRKNDLLRTFFSKYTKKKLNKKIKLDFIYTNSFMDFWKDKNGKIELKKDNSPVLFEKVDAYFEFMSMSKWRLLKAEAIPILKSNYALVCNFRPKNINIDGVHKILDIINDNSIQFVAIHDTYLDHSLQNLKISKERIQYINSQHGIITGMLKYPKKTCTFTETIMSLSILSKGKIYFIENIPAEHREMAWWVKKDNIEIKNFITEFIKELKISKEWDKIFLSLFGISYNFYNFIVNFS